MKRTTIVLGIFAGLFIIAGVFSYFALYKKPIVLTSSVAENAKTTEAVFDLGNERAEWKARIADRGIEQAYKEFKAAYKDADFSVQHQAAHVFGELMYDAKGLEGVSVCDNSFAFGCYHSLFGTAIARQGTEVVKDLDAACISAYGPLGTGCQHGIGHGIMEYFGEKHLHEALTWCASTTQKNPLFGCTSGVFMEYNTPILISSEGATGQTRAFDQNHPYAPCDTIVEATLAQSCYYELPQWLGTFTEFSKVGELCGREAKALFRKMCLMGLGQVISSRTNYSTAKVIEACAALKDAVDVLDCKAGAAWSFYSVPEKRSSAADLCLNSDTATEAACKIQAKLICTYLAEKSEQSQCAQSIEI